MDPRFYSQWPLCHLVFIHSRPIAISGGPKSNPLRSRVAFRFPNPYHRPSMFPRQDKHELNWRGLNAVSGIMFHDISVQQMTRVPTQMSPGAATGVGFPPRSTCLFRKQLNALLRWLADTGAKMRCFTIIDMLLNMEMFKRAGQIIEMNTQAHSLS